MDQSGELFVYRQRFKGCFCEAMGGKRRVYRAGEESTLVPVDSKGMEEVHCTREFRTGACHDSGFATMILRLVKLKNDI